VRERKASDPTKKQHLAAIRMLFDWLVVGQVLAINPAHAVRGPKHVVKRGKTPVLTQEEARQLLASIKW
jgi:integrase/recombinase XerD